MRWQDAPITWGQFVGISLTMIVASVTLYAVGVFLIWIGKNKR